MILVHFETRPNSLVFLHRCGKYEPYLKLYLKKRDSPNLFVSPYHLCRLFKQSIGMPPIKYINYIRIDKAKKLLQQHQLKIREAADMIGFSNYNYFSRLFKQYTQRSPSTWQQETQS